MQPILHRALLTTLRPSPRRLLCTSHAVFAPPKPPPPPPTYLSQLQGLEGAGPSGSTLAGDSPGVGPFPLPHMEREASVRAAERSWRQLKRGEKVGRAWTQLSSLVVVLIGGGVAVAVFYATATELASPNSATVLFEDASERVKNSAELQSLLIPPYSFHGSPSSGRLRRNRRVAHQLSPDGTQLQIHFWVEGTSLPSPEDEQTWWDTVKAYVGPLIWEDSHHPGSWVPSPSAAAAEAERIKQEEEKRIRHEEVTRAGTWTAWVGRGLGSLVGGIVPKRNSREGNEGASGSMFKALRKPRRGEHTSGEAVAELKKAIYLPLWLHESEADWNGAVQDPNSNKFVYQQLFVDIPDSSAPNRHRVYIPTDVVGEPAKGWDRLRFWSR